jgi:two-component system LytT family response regulator
MEKMKRVIIIDDEAQARGALRTLIESYCLDLEIIDEADGVKAGIQSILRNNPDIVFLDVQMQDGTGFDLLSQIKDVKFRVIFASAHDKFAIQAFKFSAVDYLQKPVEPEKLMAACQKTNQQMEVEEISNKLEVLLSNRKSFEKIALPTMDGFLFIHIKDILRCEAESNYTRFYFKDKHPILVSKTLREYDEMLSSFGFFRVHKSHLINLAHLREYLRGDGSVIMDDGEEIIISRRRKDDFMQALEFFFSKS